MKRTAHLSECTHTLSKGLKISKYKDISELYSYKELGKGNLWSTTQTGIFLGGWKNSSLG